MWSSMRFNAADVLIPAECGPCRQSVHPTWHWTTIAVWVLAHHEIHSTDGLKYVEVSTVCDYWTSRSKTKSTKKKKKKQELGFFHRILDPGCRFFSHFSHKGVAATTRKSLATDSPTLLALRCRRVVQSKHCVNMQLTIYVTLRQRNSFLLFVCVICRTRRSVSPPKKHGDNTLHRHFLYSRW